MQPLILFLSAMLLIGYMILSPRNLTYLVLFFSLVQLNWYARYFGGTRILRWLPLLLAGILGLRLLLEREHPKRRIGKQSFSLLYISYTIFTGLIAVIASTNAGMNPIYPLFELRYLLLSVVLMLSFIRHFGKRISLTTYKKAIVWFGLIQLPIAVLKYFIAGAGEYMTLDSVTGTFTSYGELNASQLFAICVVLGEYLRTGRKIVKANPYLLVVLLSIPLVLSQSRLASLFLVITIGYIFFTSARKRNFSTLISTILPVSILVIVISTLMYQYFWNERYNVEEQVSGDYFLSYFLVEPEAVMTQAQGRIYRPMGRWRAVFVSSQEILRGPVTALIGFGPGASTESVLMNQKGLYYAKSGEFFGLGGNELSRLILERGIIGLLAIIFLFVAAYRKCRYSSKRESLQAIGRDISFLAILLSSYTITFSSYYFSLILGAYFALADIEVKEQRQINDHWCPIISRRGAAG